MSCPREAPHSNHSAPQEPPHRNRNLTILQGCCARTSAMAGSWVSLARSPSFMAASTVASTPLLCVCLRFHSSIQQCCRTQVVFMWSVLFKHIHKRCLYCQYIVFEGFRASSYLSTPEIDTSLKTEGTIWTIQSTFSHTHTAEIY